MVAHWYDPIITPIKFMQKHTLCLCMIRNCLKFLPPIYKILYSFFFNIFMFSVIFLHFQKILKVYTKTNSDTYWVLWASIFCQNTEFWKSCAYIFFLVALNFENGNKHFNVNSILLSITPVLSLEIEVKYSIVEREIPFKSYWQ